MLHSLHRLSEWPSWGQGKGDTETYRHLPWNEMEGTLLTVLWVCEEYDCDHSLSGGARLHLGGQGSVLSNQRTMPPVG